VSREPERAWRRPAMPPPGRIAAAPISWGVCEVPGWGLWVPPERVLAEARSLGLGAIEAGPPGYLPADPVALRSLLDRFELRLVAGFVALVLHDPGRLDETLAEAGRAAAALADGGAEVLVVAAASGGAGYDDPAGIGEAGWDQLTRALERVQALSERHGLALALHPHAGTLVERTEQVLRLLDRSPVALCLDTGHLLLGGTDPAALAREVPERVRHVHLKDLDIGLAELVAGGRLGYQEAVRQGLYRPLGAGGAPIAEVVTELELAGYRHWYVLEQDLAIDAEPAPGDGPFNDLSSSLEFLGRVPRWPSVLPGPG
jgi:inosose dehydratase